MFRRSAGVVLVLLGVHAGFAWLEYAQCLQPLWVLTYKHVEGKPTTQMQLLFKCKGQIEQTQATINELRRKHRQSEETEKHLKRQLSQQTQEQAELNLRAPSGHRIVSALRRSIANEGTKRSSLRNDLKERQQQLTDLLARKIAIENGISIIPELSPCEDASIAEPNLGQTLQPASVRTGD